MKVQPTICRDCVFARYENDIQVDCTFHNRLFNLANNGAKITLVGDDSGPKKYYLIEDRVCIACRNKDSMKKIPQSEWHSYVESQIQLRLTYIIVVKQENTLEDLIKTIKGAEAQKPRPFSILVVIEPGKKPKDFDSVDVVDFLRNRSIRMWYVEDLSLEKAIKLNMKNIGVHYTIFSGGSDIPSTFSEKINKAMYYDMKKIAFLCPDKDGNGILLQKGVPITQVIAKEGIENYILTWEKL